MAGLATGAQAGPVAANIPIRRGRYRIAVDYYPLYNQVNVLPLAVTMFQEGNDWTLQPDGKILINTTGLYRAVLQVDWVAQNGTDIDMRTYGILCTRATQTRRRKPPTPFGDDRIAWYDVPGSNPPRASRYTGNWAPGVIPMGGIVTTTVDVDPKVSVVIGDIAFASHVKVNDAVIGADAVDALVVQAKVVGPNKVRVSMYNPTIASGIVVPDGALNVVAMTSVLTCGENDDSMVMLHSAMETFKAGDRVYGAVRSHVRDDYVQANLDCFMQIERYA
jgi:hypothetical protein